MTYGGALNVQKVNEFFYTEVVKLRKCIFQLKCIFGMKLFPTDLFVFIYVQYTDGNYQKIIGLLLLLTAILGGW